MREYNSSSHHLIRLPRVNAEVKDNVNSLIELDICQFLYLLYRIFKGIFLPLFDLFK